MQRVLLSQQLKTIKNYFIKKGVVPFYARKLLLTGFEISRTFVIRPPHRYPLARGLGAEYRHAIGTPGISVVYFT